MDHNNNNDDNMAIPRNTYMLSGKIMLFAVSVLFVVVLLLLSLHIYMRWKLLHLNNLRRQAQNNPNGATDNVEQRNRQGLHPDILNSLPIFVHKRNGLEVECAVCLCSLEENEKGRNLPNCKHSFHVECIDTWLSSHSNCPLCRSTIDLVLEEPTSSTINIPSLPPPPPPSPPLPSSLSNTMERQDEGEIRIEVSER